MTLHATARIPSHYRDIHVTKRTAQKPTTNILSSTMPRLDDAFGPFAWSNQLTDKPKRRLSLVSVQFLMT